MNIGSLGLTRKVDESLVIGDPNSEFFAIVTIRRVRGNKVWVNVSAPRSVPVLRGEIWGEGKPCQQ